MAPYEGIKMHTNRHDAKDQKLNGKINAETGSNRSSLISSL